MNRPELHPEILTKDGKKEFAVLPYEEFVALQEWLEDLEDLVALRAAKESEHSAPTTPLSELERRFEDSN
jgi:PHD/YefM family antitoxin component YafN of YafNO toxin-antitoxin module